MLAMSASAAVVAPTHVAEGRKTQWAPTRNFSELNARAVFAVRTPAATSPYAGEGGATAAGSGEARYYDSKLGVFLSRDSFEGSLNDAPSLHRFAYAHNRPLKYRDPSGRRIENDWPVNDPALAQARADCRSGDCQEYDNASRLLDTAGTGTAIGMGAALALEGGLIGGLYQATAAPVVDAVVAGARAVATGWGRQQLALRVATAVAEPLRRLANNAASWVDENPIGSTGLQPVTGQLRREVAEQFEKQAPRTTGTTLKELTERPVQTGSSQAVAEEASKAADSVLKPQPGSATVKYYKGSQGNHFTVEVRGPDVQPLETHLVIADEERLVTEVEAVRPSTFKRAPTSTRTIPLTNPEAAVKKQLDDIDANPHGPWAPRGEDANSCATHVCSVLYAGGASGVPQAPENAQKTLYDLFNIRLPK